MLDWLHVAKHEHESLLMRIQSLQPAERFQETVLPSLATAAKGSKGQDYDALQQPTIPVQHAYHFLTPL